MPEPLKLIQPGQQTEKQVENKTRFNLIHGVLVASGIAVLLLSYYWFVFSVRHISTDNAYIDTDLFPINSRVMGYVKEVVVGEGEPVSQGQTLAVLDDTDFNVELSYKQARYKKALADLNRGRALIRSDAISRSDLETAEANVASLKADMDGTLLKLKYTRVLSPVNGSIGKRAVQPGQFVQPGQSLFVVIPRDVLWVKANYKETQVEKIRVGDQVEIRVDAYPGLIWKGRVESIFPSSGAKMSLIPPENGTGNFTKIVQRIPVKISIEPRAEHFLRPGMSVMPTILVQ